MAEKHDGGGGGSTSFESMSHQQMLEWLDQASSFYVKAASDKLTLAAGEIKEIAQQLQFRPERVEWKGEAFQEFKDWGSSLASATWRLAYYSEDAAKWMSDASDAIALAQSAIPRYTSHKQAQENLDAAKSAKNDPDARTVKDNAEASLAKKEEENRLAAAAEMRKLSQTYSQSSAEMGKLEVPTFQPPPTAFVPPSYDEVNGSSHDIQRSPGYERSVGDSGSTGTTRPSTTRPNDDFNPVPPGDDRNGTRPGNTVRPEPPVDLNIDSVQTLPPPTATPPQTTPPVVQPPLGKPEIGPMPTPIVPGVPPRTNGLPPTGPTGGQRIPTTPPPGKHVPGPHQTGPLGKLPTTREGITGGKPVLPTTQGRPATGLPRTPVIGQEHMTGRGPTGHAGGTGPNPVGGQSGIIGGRRLAGETGGIVGGRAQQPGATSARPFTPGGTGLVRGAAAGDAARTTGQAMGRGGAPHTQGTGSQREENRGERPDYLVEDEETWQQGNRRVAPPVID
ncbi:DUF4398 domain-containing protein [Streptomyces purpureus]|uniref:DUF4398 domain-containing protein n=1 Tax=Streptomyces purpureus TaxID=1951 RepID=UPI0003A3B370|nr:DUF4398 domain-containing protein [Streptomyces purpureus]